MRDIPKGDSRLLPGKLAGVFDLRRQQWRTVMFQPDPHQNEKVLARELVEELPAGTLVVAQTWGTSASPGSTGSPTGDTTG